MVAVPENVARPPAAIVRGDAVALTCSVEAVPSSDVTSMRFEMSVISTDSLDWLVSVPLTFTRHSSSLVGSDVTVTSQATPPLGHGPAAVVVVVGAAVVVVGAAVVVVAPGRVVVVRSSREVLVVDRDPTDVEVVDDVLSSEPIADVDDVDTLEVVVSSPPSTVVEGRASGVAVVVVEVVVEPIARTWSDPPSPPPDHTTRASAAATRGTRARPNAIMTP